MVTINGLTKSYSRHKVVDDLSFSVNEGEVFALLGSNGAGKSTTIKMILGLVKKDGGSIGLKKDIRVGYSPETPYFPPYLTGLEVLDYYAAISGQGDFCKKTAWGKENRKPADGSEKAIRRLADGSEEAVRRLADGSEEAVRKLADGSEEAVRRLADGSEEAVRRLADGSEEAVRKPAGRREESLWKPAGGKKAARRETALYLLAQVGLEDSSTKVRFYSKGMLQRLALAQALLNDPELLVLDEPCAGLDAMGRIEMLEMIRALKNRGKTVILNSHILSDIEKVCDRGIIMGKGKKLKDWSQSDLKDGTTLESIFVSTVGGNAGSSKQFE